MVKRMLENHRVDFIGWLNKNRLIEDVDYRELHTGSYGVTELS